MNREEKNPGEITEETNQDAKPQETKRRRGRPRKIYPVETTTETSPVEANTGESKRRRGRPRKNRPEESNIEASSPEIQETPEVPETPAVPDPDDGNYRLLGLPESDDTPGEEDASLNENIAALEGYRFFEGVKLQDRINIPDDVYRKGKQILQKGLVQIRDLDTVYLERRRELYVQVRATAVKDDRQFPMYILFSRSRIEVLDCECPDCKRNYYNWYYATGSTRCSYKAALIQLMDDYLQTRNIGDATDNRGDRLMDAYQKQDYNRFQANASSKTPSLQLVPRLTRKNGALSVSFKIGETRLFVVKQLDVFCREVRESATVLYGTSTTFCQAEENFTEKGRAWISLISTAVQEEQNYKERLVDDQYYYGSVKEHLGSQIELFGWRMDKFAELLGSDPIDFDDKDAPQKKKQSLQCRDRNPKIRIKIREAMLSGTEPAGRTSKNPSSTDQPSKSTPFHGIRVDGKLPELYQGQQNAYYIDGGFLNRIDRDFMDKLRPLAELSSEDQISFTIGRNRLSEFYSHALPRLQEIAEVQETDPERFRSWLVPEARFFFYLDLRDGDAYCRITAKYGDLDIDLIRDIQAAPMEDVGPFRNLVRETEVFSEARHWFPVSAPEGGELVCFDTDDRIYDLMKNGTSRLMELGEVHCTKRFLRAHSVKKVKVSMKVAVASDLLNLDITTEDIPREELLDLLKSYRKKQKFYRLKEGRFVDLEDPSLKALLELTDSMHLKSSDLRKDSIRLPIYRTLYLDKLMEENEGIYSRRDKHFRELVKSFKTVRDANFEEPESLSSVLRNYQKDGYRWLRTLESWGFGGILADEMGLGKTLQVISVLLAAKEEGRTGTSLVVAPASLVFNWGEEFARFAPDLTVSLIAGTQEERQRKLEEYRDYDVLVTSYDLLKRDIPWYEDKNFQFEIIDEAQYIKNPATAAAKAVKAIRSRVRYALTGTPIENHLGELWSIFDYLMPGFLYGSDTFRKEIEIPAVKNGDETAMQRLQKMVSPFILRRKKEDVLKDLPEKLEECRYVRLAGEQQKLYDAQLLRMKEFLSRQSSEDFQQSKIQILAEITRLRQICCDPALCFDGYRGETAKREACLELIQSAIDGGHRMLVFSQFASMLEILGQELEKLGISFFRITGSTPKAKRLELVHQFNNGTVPVFLISLKAGGVGLNLTGADVVIHYDPWWNAAAQNQATDRAHRIGQKNKVTVYKLIARHTIEEKVRKLQDSKLELADQIIGGELGSLGSLSQEELLELLEV